MKKLHLVGVGLMIILVSCTKDLQLDIEMRGVKKIISYPSSIYEPNFRKTYIDSLTAEQRMSLWMNKYTFDLANNSFTPIQTRLIQELKNSLDIKYFRDTYIPTDSLNNFFTNWISRASLAGMSFLDQKELLNSLAPYSGGQDPTMPPLAFYCECSMESDWCFNKCTDDCEQKSKRGCGSWLTYGCDGVC